MQENQAEVVSKFTLEEPNGMNGVTWIEYEYNGETYNEPVIISFKDIITLFRNEGIEPSDEGIYQFTKTPVTLGAYFVIEIDDASFSLRSCFINS